MPALPASATPISGSGLALLPRPLIEMMVLLVVVKRESIVALMVRMQTHMWR